MGIVRMGPPEELILHIRDHESLSVFVESGTYKGKTAIWAANNFDSVISIENSKLLYEEVVQKYRNYPNIEFIYGDSREKLIPLLKNINQPIMFWLDAHWCGQESYGSQDQCPILDEIKLIKSSDINHYIFIDDARLFLSPPPLPNNINQWPSVDQVISCLYDESYYTLVFDDVIISVPNSAKKLVSEFCQNENTTAWNKRKFTSKQNGFIFIRKGLSILFNDVSRKIRQLINHHSDSDD